MKYEVDDSDLRKVCDALSANEAFHRHRDLMNSAIHLAREVRFSPLTSETIAARERIESMMQMNAPDEPLSRTTTVASPPQGTQRVVLNTE